MPLCREATKRDLHHTSGPGETIIIFSLTIAQVFPREGLQQVLSEGEVLNSNKNVVWGSAVVPGKTLGPGTFS